MSVIASMLLLLGSDGTAQTAALPLVEPDPKTMSQKEIREFNAQLPRDHPFYIRCVREEEIGSLVKKSYSCRTNRQWQIAYATGNTNARETSDAMQGKAVNSN